MIYLRIVAALIGLGLLTTGSDHFVVGASEVARRFGLSKVLIGAVIIGFGTSAPEMIVSGIAAAGGNADIGIGNIVGSNLANLTLVLGLAAVISPLAISSAALRREAPTAVGAMLLFAVLAQDGLGSVDAIILAVTMVVVLVVIMRTSPPPSVELEEDVEHFLEGADAIPLRTEIIRTVLGLIGTLAGAQLLVWAAVGLADAAGISGGFVGLTLVAIGTSLPEIVTCVQAARRQDSDLIIGNLLGSNLLNSLAVGATVGFLAPGAFVDPSILGLGMVLMMASSVTALLLMRRRFFLTRGEGIGLVVGYSAIVPLLA